MANATVLHNIACGADKFPNPSRASFTGHDSQSPPHVWCSIALEEDRTRVRRSLVLGCPAQDTRCVTLVMPWWWQVFQQELKTGVSLVVCSVHRRKMHLCFSLCGLHWSQRQICIKTLSLRWGVSFPDSFAEPAASCRGVKVAIPLNHCCCLLGEHQTQLKALLAPSDVRRAGLRIPQASASVEISRCSWSCSTSGCWGASSLRKSQSVIYLNSVYGCVSQLSVGQLFSSSFHFCLCWLLASPYQNMAKPRVITESVTVLWSKPDSLTSRFS